MTRCTAEALAVDGDGDAAAPRSVRAAVSAHVKRDEPASVGESGRVLWMPVVRRRAEGQIVSFGRIG